MKRIAIKLVVFLLLGATVNVGVAWGCAATGETVRVDIEQRHHSLVGLSTLIGCSQTWKWNIPVPDHLYAYSGVPVPDVIEGHEVVHDALRNVRRNSLWH